MSADQSSPARQSDAEARDADAIREAAHRLAVRSCEAQGLDVKISDPVVIGKVAAVLKAGGSGSPKQRDALRVEAVATTNGGADGDVLEDGAEDRASAAERQSIPSGAER
jgi:hypothetical protein